MHRALSIAFFALAPAAAAQSPFLDPVEATVTAASPTAIFVADFNGDGINDVASGSDRLILLPSRGAAGLGVPISLGSGPLNVEALTGGDIDGDGDGDQDLLVLDSGSGSGTPRLVWYENQGPGAAFTRRLLVSSAPSSSQIRLADLDGDGDLDFVLRDGAANSLIWYEQVAGGANQFATTVGPSLSSEWRFEDANQDGLIDVIYETELFGAFRDVRVGIGTSPGQFAIPQSVLGFSSLPDSARLTDVDGDGDLDGVLTQGKNIVLIEATAPLVFALPTLLASPDGPGSPSLEFISDFNGDGLVDIIYADIVPPFEFEQRWIAGLPGGGFSSSETTIDPIAFPGQLELLSDVTGDGLPDAISRASEGVSVWQNNAGSGPGLLAERTVTPTSGAFLTDAALLDIDDDGDLDILGLLQQSAALSVYLNDGQGAFARGAQIDLPTELGALLQPHDFDSDGDRDLLLVSGQTFPGTLSILRNDGGGSFQEQQLLDVPFPGAIIDPQVLDLDGDGDLDVVV